MTVTPEELCPKSANKNALLNPEESIRPQAKPESFHTCLCMDQWVEEDLKSPYLDVLKTWLDVDLSYWLWTQCWHNLEQEFGLDAPKGGLQQGWTYYLR